MSSWSNSEPPSNVMKIKHQHYPPPAAGAPAGADAPGQIMGGAVTVAQVNPAIDFQPLLMPGCREAWSLLSLASGTTCKGRVL
eukprot:55410-Pelagomonas_calceolata.AAC.1